MHQLLDGDSVEDPAVTRLLMINQIAEQFHCLPSAARFELDNDPERLVLDLLPIRAYIAAYQAWTSARNKIDDLKAWDGNPMMTLVETHTFELREARRAKHEAEQAREALATQDDGR